MSVGLEKHLFLSAGGIPNHPRFPLLIYPAVFGTEEVSGARDFLRLFESRAWGNCWENGVFAYHHFHSNAHEVLGVFSGAAEVEFGGEHGLKKGIGIGDVVVIPAGGGHKALSSSDDFGVVGAYPEGQRPDLLLEQKVIDSQLERAVLSVPVPLQDPVYGKEGPLFKEWLA